MKLKEKHWKKLKKDSENFFNALAPLKITKFDAEK
jgi:hypothetical protein